MKKIFTLIISALLCVSAAEAHPSRMYMIGSATPGEWSLDDMLLMQTVSDGVYEWVGDLVDGQLKFLITQGWMPSYGPAVDGTVLAVGDTALVERVEELQDNDNKFWINAGRWSLRVDLTGESPVLTAADGTGMDDMGYAAYYPEAIYPIGSATEAGWSLDNAVAVSETEFNSGIYTTTLLLQSGEIKFLKQHDWGKAYGAAEANVTISEVGEYDLASIDDSNDIKFSISLDEATAFAVTVNAVEGKLIIAEPEEQVEYPEHLYIIGPAVGGWSWDDNAQEMSATEQDGLFTWSGTLVADEMKFFVEKDFGATAYGATAANTVMSVDGEYDLIKLEADDNKFIAPAGHITLVVDLAEMTISCSEDVTSVTTTLISDSMVEVYDLTGALVLRTYNKDIQNSGLKSGIYILKSGDRTGKIIF